MAHDVFISHSSKDKPIADGVCANLESAGIRCWIAPRDIAPGEDWPAAISRAISKSRVMVLIFSANSNSSEDVGRELMLAANSKLVIIPFKIEDVEPEPGMQYYLARTHWLDAINPLTQEQIRVLVATVKSFITDSSVDGTKPDISIVGGQSGLRNRSSLSRAAHGSGPAWLRFAWLPVLLVLLGLIALMMFTPAADIPSLEPTETQTSRDLFRDDFSDMASGWDVSADEVSERYYQNGEYFIHILPGYTSNYSNSWSVAGVRELENIAIEVDVRFVSGQGAYGVIVNYLGDQSFNFIEIAPDGNWDLVQKSGGYFSDLVLFRPSSVIRTGASTNHLRIELSESSVLYVNDQFVSNLDIPHMASGVGLWATAWSGSGFEAAFDNLVITRLP